LLAGLFTGRQQLAVTQNGRQRIVQFVRHSRDELSNCRHLLALQQLLLSAPQVFVRLFGLVVEQSPVDRARNLAAYRDQQFVSAGENSLVSGCPPLELRSRGPSTTKPRYTPRHLFLALGIPQRRRQR